jgi:putative transposase
MLPQSRTWGPRQVARKARVSVSVRQRSILEGWVRNKADTPYRLIERTRIVLMSAEGRGDAALSRRLGIERKRVGRWRSRWAASEERLKAAEDQGASDKDLAGLMRGVLSDEHRPGAPSTFSAEQLTQIIAVACEQPQDSGRTVTHWTPTELADEVMQRGIVESISPRHVDRILKGGISAHTRASTG